MRSAARPVSDFVKPLHGSIKLELALQVLGRYIPRDSDDADRVIQGAQACVAEALDNGHLPAARLVANCYRSAVSQGYEGIADQWRPLIEHLGQCVDKDPQLAGAVMPLARDLGLEGLRAQCLSRLCSAFGEARALRQQGR